MFQSFHIVVSVQMCSVVAQEQRMQKGHGEVSTDAVNILGLQENIKLNIFREVEPFTFFKNNKTKSTVRATFKATKFI